MTSLQEQFDEVLGRLRQAHTDLQDVEVKAAGGGLPRSAVESVSAFANAEGGLLILGLDEWRAFQPVEIDAAKLAADLASACADQLEPPIRPERRSRPGAFAGSRSEVRTTSTTKRATHATACSR